MRTIIVVACGMVLLAFGSSASENTWESKAVAGPVSMRVEAARGQSRTPVVVYLCGLSAPRVGQEGDESILADFRREGFVVVTVNYNRHERARPPFLHLDIDKLRRDIQAKRLLADQPVDFSRIFVVPAGCRLLRGVVYFRSETREWAMDVIYPSKPERPVGLVLEFSCDNQDRFGNFSLTYCSDTLLEGFASAGFAAAMADHPVAAPYKGLDPMPDSALKVKAAVRRLRALGAELGLNGRIVPVGFSRGSGMALMLVTTAGRLEFESAGEHRGFSSDVQGAVVLSGRFTYMDLLPNDKMIPRYETAWGGRGEAEDVWRRHGALDYLGSAPNVPLFLSINNAESPDALHQMDVLRKRLETLGAHPTYLPENDGRGHKVPLDLDILQAMHAYMASRLR